MGLLFSYFRRPKDAVAELESIDANLSRLETWRQSQLRLQKRLLGYLLMAFLLGYPTTLAVYYAYCMPVSSWLVQGLHVAAFVAALPLFYGFRRLLLWLFVRSLSGCEARVQKLREDKKCVLDRVMETETYKRAKEILDRFDPDRFRVEFQQPQQQHQNQQLVVRPGQFFNKSPVSKRQPLLSQSAGPRTTTSTPHLPHPPAGAGGVVLRQLSAVPSAMPSPQQPPPHLQQQPAGSPPQAPNMLPPPQFLPLPPSQQRQLPRPVLSRERTLMDRVLDMIVGDGADRRYALICRRCCGHNGMALAEEFPYLAWRCAYCALMHAPRQQRPTAPLLTQPLPPLYQQPPLQEQVQSSQQQPQPRRPQWQSLIDLRPQTNPAAEGALTTQSLRSSSSSSAASTPSPTRAPSSPFELKANGGEAADVSEVVEAAEALTKEVQESGASVRRRSRLTTEPSE